MGFQRKREDKLREEEQARQEGLRAEEREYQKGIREQDWAREDTIRRGEEITSLLTQAQSGTDVDNIIKNFTDEERDKYRVQIASAYAPAEQRRKDLERQGKIEGLELEVLQRQNAEEAAKKAGEEAYVLHKPGEILTDPYAIKMAENALETAIQNGDWDLATQHAAKIGEDAVSRVKGRRRNRQTNQELTFLTENFADMSVASIYDRLSQYTEEETSNHPSFKMLQGMLLGKMERDYQGLYRQNIEILQQQNQYDLQMGQGLTLEQIHAQARDITNKQQNSQLNRILEDELQAARREIIKSGIPEDQAWEIAKRRIQENDYLMKYIKSPSVFEDSIRPKFERGLNQPTAGIGMGSGSQLGPQEMSDIAYADYEKKQGEALDITSNEDEVLKLRALGKANTALANDPDWEFYLRYRANPDNIIAEADLKQRRIMPHTWGGTGYTSGPSRKTGNINPAHQRWQRVKNKYDSIAERMLRGGAMTPVDAGINLVGQGGAGSAVSGAKGVGWLNG
tara:strand:+ start:6210 stop:7742 length:1533 start_codon:yes stop_codon:yes gene_type:complete